MTPKTAEHDSEKSPERYTHLLNCRQCCRIRTCSSWGSGTCSLAPSPMLHTAVAWSHTFIQHNKHISNLHLPTTTHVPKYYENDSRDDRTWQWEAIVWYTHPASWRQRCRSGICSSCCFDTCSLTRSPTLHTAVAWSHSHIQHNKHNSAEHIQTTTHVPKCYENDWCDYRTWQWRAYSEINSPCKLTAVLSYQNLQ